MNTVRVENVEQIVALVREAVEAKRRLRIVGGGSKRPLFDLDEVDTRLEMSGLAGITRYEPEELVLSLRAGTRLAEVEAVLGERGQMLAFEPPDFGRLLGEGSAHRTIGGVVASGLAGPRRVSAGNVRDHVLGFEAVSGRGEAFRAGGKVIKNVTGYDLPKLMAGSWGTLAVLTELHLRVLPRPPHQATLMIEGLDDQRALSAMTRALQAPLEVSAAAHLPGARTALRLEGYRASVEERLSALRSLLGSIAPMRQIEAEESQALWRGVRDLDIFANDARILWRLSLPASASTNVVAKISASASNDALYDWGGGRVWLALRSPADAAASGVRECASEAGGHAWLMRAPDALRRAIPVAHPQSGALAALSRRIKQGFDPNNVFGDAPLLDS